MLVIHGERICGTFILNMVLLEKHQRQEGNVKRESCKEGIPEIVDSYSFPLI